MRQLNDHRPKRRNCGVESAPRRKVAITNTRQPHCLFTFVCCLQRRLESCASFGGWTSEDARAWWSENGPSLAVDSTDVDDAELTLTRQASPEAH